MAHLGRWCVRISSKNTRQLWTSSRANCNLKLSKVLPFSCTKKALYKSPTTFRNLVVFVLVERQINIFRHWVRCVNNVNCWTRHWFNIVVQSCIDAVFVTSTSKNFQRIILDNVLVNLVVCWIAIDNVRPSTSVARSIISIPGDVTRKHFPETLQRVDTIL